MRLVKAFRKKDITKLIPVKIIDVTGRLTTVYKKPYELESMFPVISEEPPEADIIYDQLTKISNIKRSLREHLQTIINNEQLILSNILETPKAKFKEELSEEYFYRFKLPSTQVNGNIKVMSILNNFKTNGYKIVPGTGALLKIGSTAYSNIALSKRIPVTIGKDHYEFLSIVDINLSPDLRSLNTKNSRVSITLSLEDLKKVKGFEEIQKYYHSKKFIIH